MHTGMVQPSGPSIHCRTSSESVWAQYTAAGGALKRLVTTTYLSPSVFRLNLLISSPLLFSSSDPWRPEPHRAARNFSPEPGAALSASDPLRRFLPSRGGADVWFPECDSRSDRRLRVPSSAGKLPVG